MARRLSATGPIGATILINLEADGHSGVLDAIYDLLTAPGTNWKSVTLTHGNDGDYVYTLAPEVRETSVEIG
jgi:hypothetical protein